MYKDEIGRWRTLSLFKETAIPVNPQYPPVFSLKDPDPDSPDQPPSFKEMFIESGDITGYTVAKEVLGSWKHFQKLLRSKWFKEHFDEWVSEVEVKLRSEGLRKIQAVSKGDNASAYQAAKYLSDKGWEEKRGRPSKAEKAKIAAKEKALEEAVEDDLSRVIRLRSI